MVLKGRSGPGWRQRRGSWCFGETGRLLGVPGADRIFHVVYFAMVANALVPGATVARVSRRLGLQKAEAPAPQAVLAIESRLPLEGELISFYIDEALVVTGCVAPVMNRRTQHYNSSPLLKSRC